jgi:hypothetical protein
MALFIENTTRIGWVSDGGGGNATLGQYQANIPGQGQTQQPHMTFVAQMRQYIVGEPVPIAAGSEGSVTLANIKTALDAISVDLAGSTGAPIITPAELAIIQGWASGGP